MERDVWHCACVYLHMYKDSVSYISGYLIGVGDGSVRNRYCPIAFGSFIDMQGAHFLEVDGQRCFPASVFPRARTQLINAGVVLVPAQAIAASRPQSRLYREEVYPF